MKKSPALPAGIRFKVPAKGRHKYVAIFPDGRRVRFGHRDYEHFKDSVPPALGGGKWRRKDHDDPQRRRNYRKRHGAQRCADGRACVRIRYSPAWFSYNFLW